MTTNAHHQHWQHPHWRMAPDMPLGRDRGFKMAFIVGINSALWVAMLATAWFLTHG